MIRAVILCCNYYTKNINVFKQSLLRVLSIETNIGYIDADIALKGWAIAITRNR